MMMNVCFENNTIWMALTLFGAYLIYKFFFSIRAVMSKNKSSKYHVNISKAYSPWTVVYLISIVILMEVLDAYCG